MSGKRSRLTEPNPPRLRLRYLAPPCPWDEELRDRLWRLDLLDAFRAIERIEHETKREFFDAYMEHGHDERQARATDQVPR